LFVLFYYHFLVVVHSASTKNSQRFSFSFFFCLSSLHTFFQPPHTRKKRYLLFGFRYIFH
jgi:hypothetical protein